MKLVLPICFLGFLGALNNKPVFGCLLYLHLHDTMCYHLSVSRNAKSVKGIDTADALVLLPLTYNILRSKSISGHFIDNTSLGLNPIPIPNANMALCFLSVFSKSLLAYMNIVILHLQ